MDKVEERKDRAVQNRRKIRKRIKKKKDRARKNRS